MGGSDDPSNLIEVTIEEHAELHLDLYLTHGKVEDYIAYNMLSGKTEEGERARRLMCSEYMKNRIISEETKEKMRQGVGRLHTPEVYAKRSKTMTGEGNHFYGKTHTEENKEVISQRAKEQWEKTKYIWVNNGESNRRVDPNNIPEGFVKGRYHKGNLGGSRRSSK